MNTLQTIRCLLLTIAFAFTTSEVTKAQDWLGNIADRVRNQVGNQIRDEIQRSVPFQSFPPLGIPRQPPGNQVETQGMGSYSLPNESGGQNLDNKFSDNGFFQPSNPPPSYVKPQPQYVQPQPYYVQPNYSQPQQQLLYPNNSSYLPNQGGIVYSQNSTTYPQPATRSSKPVAGNGQPIKLRLGKSMNQAVSYQLVLSGKTYPYTMRKGESQSFDDTREWLVRFIRGNSEVNYRLSGGNEYTFDLDPEGLLQLYREPAKSTVITEPPLRKPN